MAHNMFVGSGKRSGTRGGADQFSWDKVKGDKYKDFYLGHSLHTTAKPTFNNRKPNPLWWTKSQSGAADDEARRRAEIEAIKREEEQLHLEALGLAPRRRKAQENQLDATEIQELTRRGNTERDAYDAERVAGLGYAPAPQHQLDTEGGLVGLKGRTDDKEQEGGGAGEREAAAAGHGRTGDKEEEWVEVKAERSKKRSKEERREDKQQRKEEKMKDKKEKRERKGRKDKHRADRHTAVDSDRRREHRRDHEGGDHKRPHHDRPSDNTEAPQRQHQPYRRHRHRESARSPARSPSPKRVRRHDSPSPPRSRYSRSS